MGIYRLTPETELRSEITIKKSRFIGIIKRIESVEAARNFITDCRREFPTARHHCNAYLVSVPGAQDIANSSDDGEPSGTAGKPMLNILLHADITDVVSVVVRYFGGTLLGTGGLVRAYSDSLQLALQGAKRWQEKTMQQLDVTLPLAEVGKIEAALRRKGYEVLSTTYLAKEAEISLATTNSPSAEAFIAELSGGTAQIHSRGEIRREIAAGVF